MAVLRFVGLLALVIILSIAASITTVVATGLAPPGCEKNTVCSSLVRNIRLGEATILAPSSVRDCLSQDTVRRLAVLASQIATPINISGDEVLSRLKDGEVAGCISTERVVDLLCTTAGGGWGGEESCRKG